METLCIFTADRPVEEAGNSVSLLCSLSGLEGLFFCELVPIENSHIAPLVQFSLSGLVRVRAVVVKIAVLRNGISGPK